MGRQGNGRSTIYFGNDGYWHGRVTVGVRDDGRADRRHVRGTSKAVVVWKVRDLEKERDRDRVRKPGQRWTVEAWLMHWLEHIARPNVRETSFSAYRVAVTRHLVPGVGAHRLDRLEPEHLERLYRRMADGGSSPGNAHQVHRTARTALGEAVRRGHVSRNVAALARAPRVSQKVIDPYTVDEVQRILKVAREQRNSVRRAFALALGLRQGETLALRWSDVDWARHRLTVRNTRLRPAYEHGCGGGCGRRAGYCPNRRRSNAEVGETKSAAGQRVLGLPKPLVDLLSQHQAEQDREREVAAQLWEDGDWVFASPHGGPAEPEHRLPAVEGSVACGGVRDGRLHDARHTAATVLLLLGVPERAARGVMGWSTTAMAARYQHVTDPIRQDIAKRVGDLLWAPQAEDDEAN
jgi:integrase